MRFHFTAERDEETGELGWKEKRVQPGSPYGPLNGDRGLTHDCLEHFSLSELSDEIEAHAAIYWGRLQGSGNVTTDGLGSEWWGICRAIRDGHTLRMPPRTCSLDRDIEEDIGKIIHKGRRAVLDEIGDDPEGCYIADQIEKAFRGWFRIGFRKAERRWRRWNYGPVEVSHLFDQLENLFSEQVYGRRRCYPEREGQELVLTITRKDGIRFRDPEY